MVGVETDERRDSLVPHAPRPAGFFWGSTFPALRFDPEGHPPFLPEGHRPLAGALINPPSGSKGAGA